MKHLLPYLLPILILGCATTPQQQQTLTAAENIASMAVGIYAASPGSKISPAQAAQVQQLIAATQANPQAAAIASNSLYGGMAMAQAGVPVASGASAAPVGSAIAAAVPAGLSTNDKAALLAQAAALVANPKAAL